MTFPEDLKYSKEHEWVKVSGNVATIGSTDYAQEQLGEIVFVELPDEGEALEKNDAFGVVESVKSVSDVFTPLAGLIAEVNEPLLDSPETVNEEPYGEGWLVKLEISNPKDVEELMTAEQYQAYIKEETA